MYVSSQGKKPGAERSFHLVKNKESQWLEAEVSQIQITDIISESE